MRRRRHPSRAVGGDPISLRPASPSEARSRATRVRGPIGRSSGSRAVRLWIEPDSYRPSLPRLPGPVLRDGFRSHLPLRGSPGFAPGSLLRRSGTPSEPTVAILYIEDWHGVNTIY
jgi:hypothetical protein